MATRNDVKALAGQLGITLTDHGQAFDLESKADAPLQFEGTFRKEQVAIDHAYVGLVRHRDNLRSMTRR